MSSDEMIEEIDQYVSTVKEISIADNDGYLSSIMNNMQPLLVRGCTKQGIERRNSSHKSFIFLSYVTTSLLLSPHVVSSKSAEER